jgi:DNA-binding PadR family transcriptional regulator
MTKPAIQEFLPLTAVTFHVLLSLVDGVRHGYGIKREVEDRTSGAIRLGAGTLYEGIQRMERKGLLRETKPPKGAELESGSRWRFYAITKLGRAVLEAEVARLELDVRHATAKVRMSKPRRA